MHAEQRREDKKREEMSKSEKREGDSYLENLGGERIFFQINI